MHLSKALDKYSNINYPLGAWVNPKLLGTYTGDLCNKNQKSKELSEIEFGSWREIVSQFSSAQSC